MKYSNTTQAIIDRLKDDSIRRDNEGLRWKESLENIYYNKDTK